jgi:hypothetical protein
MAAAVYGWYYCTNQTKPYKPDKPDKPPPKCDFLIKLDGKTPQFRSIFPQVRKLRKILFYHNSAAKFYFPIVPQQNFNLPQFRSKNVIFLLFRSKNFIFPQFRSKNFIFPQFRSKSRLEYRKAHIPKSPYTQKPLYRKAHIPKSPYTQKPSINQVLG